MIPYTAEISKQQKNLNSTQTSFNIIEVATSIRVSLPQNLPKQNKGINIYRNDSAILVFTCNGYLFCKSDRMEFGVTGLLANWLATFKGTDNTGRTALRFDE